MTCDFQDGKAVKEVAFSKLMFADSGVYVCEVSMTGLRRRKSFELFVEGQQLFNSPVSFNEIPMNSVKMPSLCQLSLHKGEADVPGPSAPGRRASAVSRSKLFVAEGLG